MTKQPYEYITQYENGFDIDLAVIGKTDSYRVTFRATPKGGVTDIATFVNGDWNYDVAIPNEAMTIIRKYSKLYYNAEF